MTLNQLKLLDSCYTYEKQVQELLETARKIIPDIREECKGDLAAIIKQLEKNVSDIQDIEKNIQDSKFSDEFVDNCISIVQALMQQNKEIKEQLKALIVLSDLYRTHGVSNADYDIDQLAERLEGANIPGVSSVHVVDKVIGKQMLVALDNNYMVSVINYDHPFEAALIDPRGDLCYNNGAVHGVDGHLSEDEVLDYIEKAAELPEFNLDDMAIDDDDGFGEPD